MGWKENRFEREHKGTLLLRVFSLPYFFPVYAGYKHFNHSKTSLLRCPCPLFKGICSVQVFKLNKGNTTVRMLTMNGLLTETLFQTVIAGS